MAVRKKVSTPKKKTVSKKRAPRSKKTRKPLVLSELKKIAAGLLILTAVCLTGAMIADIFFQSGRLKEKEPLLTQPGDINKKSTDPHPVTQVKEKKKAKGLKIKGTPESPMHPITYEVYKDIPTVVIEKPIVPAKDTTPQIALIIDDIGYDKKIALALYDLNPNITFSVLPFSPFGKTISEKLHKKGAQLMLHLPMEPVEYPEVNPGPGAILSSMSPDTLLAQLKKDILDVPHIQGVNNHMGSKLTVHADQMNQIFTILKKENLFFIDSRTAPKSQGKASARLFKLKFAQRDVFLDNIQEETYIAGQLKELVELAQKHGSAIGIGHPYKATLRTLLKELPKLKGKIKVVRADSLTAIPG